MYTRSACICIFSPQVRVLTILGNDGLFSLPTVACGEDTPSSSIKKFVKQSLEIKLRSKLMKVCVAKQHALDCYGYLYTKLFDENSITSPEVRWIHPSQMDNENARFAAYNRYFFGILRGVGFVDVLPKMELPKMQDPADKFRVLK